MKKRLSLIVALTLVLISLFTLGLSNKQVNAATLSDQEKVDQEINNIVMPEKAIIDFPVVSTSAYGSTITWESNNSAVLNVPQNGGWVVVTRPTDADAVVELKVTITLNQATAENTFEILVPKGVTETNTYRINYVLNGGVQNASNPASYKVGTTPVLAAPTKGTVEFLGWYDNAEFEGSAMTQLPKGLSGDYTVYAKWAPTVLDSIEVTKAPTKVVYNALESFDPTGIEVEAHYNDGTSKALSLEEIQSITYDLDVLHYGNNKVVATYEGKTAEIAITVNKLQYDLSNVVFLDATKTYNGQAQTLTAEGVPAGLTAVVDGSATHVAEGAVTITLSFVNSNPDYEDVTEEITATLTITPASATVTARSATFKVGTTPTFNYSVSGLIGNDQLSGTAVYECAANNTSPAGDYPVKVSGLSNSDYVVTFVDGVITMNDGQYMIVVDDADLVKVYNGQNQMFTPRLMDGNTEIEGIVFTYSYNDVEFTGATDVKVYSVVVSYDSGTYGSGSQTFTFEITARSLEQAWFEELPAVSYNGSAHTPDVVGKYNDKPLVKDVDYTLSYEANTQVGTATVTVTGKGNFKDSCDLHFVIRVADLERVQATRVELEQTYAALNGKLDKVEDLMVESTTNETSIFWMSTSTAMSVSAEGKVSVILTSEEQTVVLYALITAGDAAEYAMFTVTLPKQVSTSDEESQVTVEGVQEGAVVKVEQTDGSEVNFEVVGDEEVIAGYEITLQQNNQTVQPMDEVTVKLPVPAGYNQDTLKVYYVNGEEQTDMNAYVEGEYLVFTTTHFSKYIVVGEPEQQQEETKITIAEFLEKEVNAEVYYELTGVISGIYNESYGNFYLVDQNDSSVQVLVYGLTATKVTSNDLSFASLGLNNGDVVTLMGTRDDYKGTTQVGGPAYYVSHVAAPHQHVLCDICQGCTADNCDGSVAKCEGHTVASPLVEGQAYTISAANKTALLYFDGTVTSGRFNGTTDYSKAAKIYVEISNGLYYIYFNDASNVKQYVVMDDKAAGCALTSDKASATLFEWNATLATLEVEDDTNARAFGCQTTSESTSFSSYAVSNTTGYNWGQYNAYVEGETPVVPSHTHTLCDTCQGCTAEDCDGTIDKCEGHTVTPSHEHDVCATCGGCKSEDCDGTLKKCEGHTVAPSQTVTVKLSIADAGSANGWNGDANSLKNAYAIDENISISVAGGANSGKFYTDHIRIYATDSPAGSITLTAKEGYKIKSVSFELVTGTYAFLQYDSSTVENGQVVEVGAQTATFTTAKNGSDGKQVRVLSVTVVYEANNN